jgi:hypothetical protein
LFIVEVVDDHPDRQPKKTIELAHPFRVALGQVVVHRDHVDSSAAQRIQIDGQSGNQRFTFASLHFCDLAVVQDHPADQLHVKMAHIQDAAAGLAHHGKGFNKDFIERFFQDPVALFFDLLGAVWISVRFILNLAETLLDALAKLVRLGAKLFVAGRLHLRFKRVNGLHVGHQALDFPLVLGSEDLA